MFTTTSTHPRGVHARASLVGLTLAGLLALTACGDDTTEATDAPSLGSRASASRVTDAAPTEAEAPTLEVTMVDFGYGGLPEVISAGTMITVRNESERELHELVAVRLPDGDDRPVTEIVDTDLGELLSAGPPSLVVLAEPGSDTNIVAVGDGALHEPGRYLLICAIPSGVDPAAYLQAAAESNGEKPEVEGGPPHFVHGMYADITVVGG